MPNATELSEQLLRKVKLELNTNVLTTTLAQLELKQLHQDLSSDAFKKCFWMNCYNAFFLLGRRQGLTKPNIYRNRYVCIAGLHFSLDEIEHGILRRFRSKYACGWLPALFVPTHIKKLAVQNRDFRIHFALNCGAKSCPPIAFYSAQSIEEQLQLATLSFVTSETSVDEEQQLLRVSTLFKWYLGDFGGKQGIKKLLKATLGIETKGMKVLYSPYNWDEDLNNFV